MILTNPDADDQYPAAAIEAGYKNGLREAADIVESLSDLLQNPITPKSQKEIQKWLLTVSTGMRKKLK